MKKKFLTLFLTLFVSFSSINFSFANPLLSLSPQIIATIGTLAVSSGIVLNDNDDLYDIARIVYEDIKRQNDDIEKIFLASVSLATNGILTVGGEFLDLIKNSFDSFYSKSKDSVSVVDDFIGLGFTGLSCYDKFIPTSEKLELSAFSSYPSTHKFNVGANYIGVKQNIGGGFYVILSEDSSKYYEVDFYKNDIRFTSSPISKHSTEAIVFESTSTVEYNYLWVIGNSNGSYLDKYSIALSPSSDYSPVYLPSQPNYTWDNIDSNKDENGNIGIYFPGNLDSLVGGNVGNTIYDGVYNPGYDVSTDGSVSIPQVSNPSISIGDNLTIPSDTVVDTPIDPPADLPDVNDPPIGGIIPSFPSFGDSLDFSPMYLTNINEKFPFSLPWDIGRLIEKFDVEPKAPIFKVPIVTSDIELDLTIFDEWANIVRFFILIGFALSLILISTKLLG